MQPLPGNSDVAAIVSTDASGNIIGPYSVGLNNDPDPSSKLHRAGRHNQRSSGFQGTNDISYTGTLSAARVAAETTGLRALGPAPTSELACGVRHDARADAAGGAAV